MWKPTTKCLLMTDERSMANDFAEKRIEIYMGAKNSAENPKVLDRRTCNAQDFIWLVWFCNLF